MIRIFLDANVIFSATISRNGVCRAIFDVSEKIEDVQLVCTGYAREEARFNLERKYPVRLEDLGELLKLVSLADEPPASLVEEVAGFVPDPDDRRILAGAISSLSDILVTGNSRDFGHLYGTRVANVAVMRPRDVLEFLIS